MTRLRASARLVTLLGLALLAGVGVSAQSGVFSRLPAEALDAATPMTRVRGVPGSMTLLTRDCRSVPTSAVRRRIVDIAVQEWAFFGFPIAAANTFEGEPSGGDTPILAGGLAEPGFPGPGDRRRSRIPPEEAMRVAASIAGYWAVTPEGSWIVERQNDAWQGPAGAGARWQNPWSAAFISWVMCEAGLGAPGEFQRAVAHHTYVDQAIRARDGAATLAAYVARDAGEVSPEPGDLFCTSRRPSYRTIAERRRQSGVGARMHCDIVVQVDEDAARLLVIGGNVRGVVAMKVLPAMRSARGHLRPVDQSTSQGVRPFFAHLDLRAAPIDVRALDATPTFKAITCQTAFRPPVQLAGLNLAPPTARAC